MIYLQLKHIHKNSAHSQVYATNYNKIMINKTTTKLIINTSANTFKIKSKVIIKPDTELRAT